MSPNARDAPKPSIEQLQQRMRQLSQAHGAGRARSCFSSGSSALDAWLAEGGLPRGGLLEWLGGPGGGAGTLAMLAAASAMRGGGYLVVLDRRRRFYPPAAAAWGVCLQRTIVVRPRGVLQWQWAATQALRCSAVAAVWAETPPAHDDELQSVLRSWRLAAEQSGAAGLLVRPLAAERSPHWADVRLRVQPQRPPDDETALGLRRRFLVRVLRGAAPGARPQVLIELPSPAAPWNIASDHEQSSPRRPAASALSLAAQLAHPKKTRRSARA